MTMKQWLRRSLAALLTVAMLLGAAPLPPVQAETSVQARTNGAVAWAEDRAATRGEVVEMLLAAADDYNPGVTKEDIIRGYEDGDLREGQSVTRAEALVMLARAFGPLPERKGVNAAQAIPADSFSDIPAWAAETLAPVFEAGTSGRHSAGRVLAERGCDGAPDGTLHPPHLRPFWQQRTG